MKKIIPLFLLALAFAACSKKIEFELFSAEAFAYSLDSGYELDARTMVKGFKLEESNSLFTSRLLYSVDLVLPDGKVKKGFASGIAKKEEREEFTEMEISIQQQMDSTFAVGKYKVVFNVTDDIAKKQLKIEKEFDLSE